MNGVTIEQMTCVSHIFAVAAVGFAVLAVVMFFVFDIRGIWTVLYGRGTVARYSRLRRRSVGRGMRKREGRGTASLAVSVTEKMEERILEGTVDTEVLAFDGGEETVPLGEMCMLQDITYTEYLGEEAI